MDSTAEFKTIMARFQGGTDRTEIVSPSNHAGRPKNPLQPMLSTFGTPPQPKKPVLESLSGGAISIPPKPNYLKSTVSTQSAPEARESSKAKAHASMFSNAQEDDIRKPLFPNKPVKPPPSQDAVGKIVLPKPPLHKASFSSTLPESKPAPTIPSPGLPAHSKPPWVKDDGKGSPTNTSPTPPKLPLQPKPSSSFTKLVKQNEDSGGENPDSATRPFSLPTSVPKPTSNFRTALNAFNNGESPQQTEEGLKVEGFTKLPLGASNSAPPPKPPASKKPSFVRRQVGSSSLTNSVSGDELSVPPKNPLPNILALGPPPAKPNRPPRVNLERFKRGGGAANDGPGTFKKTVVPPPPASHPSNHSNSVTPPLSSHPPAPSLPPRPQAAIIQSDPDENYDDVGVMNNVRPPLPPSTGHPSQRREEEVESNDETYEDLDERWEAADLKEQDAKKEKEDKGKKEKKEQKEREKKEQEARKKFKLVGPLPVIHRVKARVDHRGSKTELSMKQGESIDIIRVQGNPEGKWLGRTKDGAYGYVKTDAVDIDFDSLKRQGETVSAPDDYDPEVYDDIDIVSSDNFNSGAKGRGVVLPPPPEEEGEIYDDVVDPSLDVSRSGTLDLKLPPVNRGFLRMFERKRGPGSIREVPPPSQFTTNGSAVIETPAVIDEDIYDDVDAQGFPPPPPASSLPTLRTKPRAEEMDPKKQKKFEKEEKDFRKKFKYEGEVQVLYQVTTVSNLTNKKWSSKDLPIKAGETLDVIAKAADNKLICRNDEGKFGYVSNSYIAEDADIYDDVGDGCVYDND